VGGMDHLKVQDVEEYTYFCYIHVVLHPHHLASTSLYRAMLALICRYGKVCSNRDCSLHMPNYTAL
jgi:hypothetical protein